MSISTRLFNFLVLFLLLQAARFTQAHDGHGHDAHLVESPANKAAPIDTLLRMHIISESLIWGIIFPVGMVLGLSRSRYHVPMQVTATVVSIGGMQLARKHGGRQFSHASHGNFAPWLFWVMLIQAGIGIYLKMHVMEGSYTRWITVKIHGVLGRLFPVIGYTQMVLGVILGLDICAGPHLGQCLAHFIMGSSFIGYGIIILVMSMYGAPWLEKYNISQEFMDSTVIMTFGIVITFTMHGFIEPAHGGWSHKDMQHTAMGVLFWTGGALGMWLGRNRKRNIWPALVVALTGFAMSGHEQENMLSTNVHAIFGYTLMAAGVCRIIEICFVLKEGHQQAVRNQESGHMSPFQHMTPFLLIVGGLEFMSATEEQLAIISAIGMDHVTYIVIMFCMGFIIYLWSNLLISLYHNSGRNAEKLSQEHLAASRPGLWRLLVSGATAHYGHDSVEPKIADYEAMLYSARSDDSIELGARTLHERSSSSRHSEDLVYESDSESNEMEDNGDDSYWEGHTSRDDEHNDGTQGRHMHR